MNTDKKYFSTLGSVLAFKITPDTKDTNKWPQWLKDKLKQNDTFENDIIYFDNDYLHVSSSLIGNKIINNGHYIIQDQRGRLNTIVDYVFEKDYVEN